MTLDMMSLALRGHREYVGNGGRHAGYFLALVAMQARFHPVLQDLLETPAQTAKYLNTTIQVYKPKGVYPKSVNGVNEITQHAVSFGTQVMFETPHYDYSVTGQTEAPHEILSMAPECDATSLAGSEHRTDKSILTELNS